MKKKFGQFFGVIIIMALLMITGCKNEKKEWNRIQTSTNITEIEDFISDFPQSQHLGEAKELLSYNKLLTDSTLANYERFINQYPSNKKINEVKKRLNELKSDSAYQVAVKVDSVSSLESFLKEYPDSKKFFKAKEKLRNLLIKNLVPDWIFVIDGTIRNRSQKVGKQALGGIWYGEHSSYRISSDMSLEFVLPDPKHQKVIVVILFNEGLPKELENEKAYLWRGNNDFTFITDIKKNQDVELLLTQLGLKQHGVPHPTYIPF